MLEAVDRPAAWIVAVTIGEGILKMSDSNKIARTKSKGLMVTQLMLFSCSVASASASRLDEMRILNLEVESFSRALGISKIRALVTPFHPLQMRDNDGGNMKIIWNFDKKSSDSSRKCHLSNGGRRISGFMGLLDCDWSINLAWQTTSGNGILVTSF